MPPSEKYSAALRCIGQALEQKGIDIFDLVCSGDEFLLQCGDPEPPHLALLELRYSRDDIQELESQGQAKRGRSFKTVNFEGLPETLRALGQRIDSVGGTLRRICSEETADSGDALRLEYQTRDRNFRVERLTPAALYQHCVRMYKERSRTTARDRI
ncbi:MAG TPA: hypothetical protein VNN77_09160 [candidate division Zixibacteria bacterium]|nr:hypothetical protein [candidate division Zixibacteria bacterium]